MSVSRTGRHFVVGIFSEKQKPTSQTSPDATHTRSQRYKQAVPYMEIKTPSIIFSISLSALLIIPFLIKQLHSEPYPAIIFPGGQGQIKISDQEVSHTEYKIKSYNNGAVSDLQPEILLPDMPARYRKYVIRNNLGFPLEGEKIELHLLEELIQYYKNNIQLPVDSIQIETIKVKRSTSNGALVEEKIKEIKTYQLN